MSRPTTALLIDDEAHVRAYLRLILAELGITQCWEASDGVTGLALALQHRPGLVLLDLNLPAMNGLAVLERLEQEAPEIPAVVVTAQTAIKSVHEAERLGAVAYLLKHSPRESVRATLQDAIDSLVDAEEAEPAPPL